MLPSIASRCDDTIGTVLGDLRVYYVIIIKGRCGRPGAATRQSQKGRKSRGCEACAGRGQQKTQACVMSHTGGKLWAEP